MRLVFTIRSQYKRWYPTGTLPSSVCISGWCCEHPPAPRKGHTHLVKLDIQDAYRIVPVHPSDCNLLGIHWNGGTYIDIALPFGLRSAPKIFNAVADFIALVLVCNGIHYQLHYLDDFLFLAAQDSNRRSQVLSIALQTLRQLGIPVTVHKTEGPTTVFIFLGILIDTHRFELRLPTDKLLRLQEMIATWTTKCTCQWKELESLLGHLCHAATDIHQGRIFLCDLFPLPWTEHPITFA